MFPIYLNAGFGQPIGAPTLELIRSLGFAGIRQSQDTSRQGSENVDVIVKELADNYLDLLFCINSWDGIVAEVVERALVVRAACRRYSIPCTIEVINEPNLKLLSPSYYDKPLFWADTVRAVYDAVGMDGVKVIAGGIAGTGQGDLAYLASAEKGIPDRCGIGVHTYRGRDRSPDAPHPGFKDRMAEFSALFKIADGREVWGTEVGWHTANDNKWYEFCRKPLTDQQVHDFLVREFRIYRQAGLKIGTLYQWSDGPGNSPNDRFGIRRLDDTLKPSAMVPQEV